MLKRSIKSVALLSAVLLMFVCFAGCKKDKDVYGAASEFIKVNHPETQNKNIFSDDDYTGSDSTSSQDNSSVASGGSSDASGNDTSSGSATGSSDVSGGGSSETVTSSGSGASMNDKPIDGDFGPVVAIP